MVVKRVENTTHLCVADLAEGVIARAFGTLEHRQRLYRQLLGYSPLPPEAESGINALFPKANALLESLENKFLGAARLRSLVEEFRGGELSPQTEDVLSRHVQVVGDPQRANLIEGARIEIEQRWSRFQSEWGEECRALLEVITEAQSLFLVPGEVAPRSPLGRLQASELRPERLVTENDPYEVSRLFEELRSGLQRLQTDFGELQGSTHEELRKKLSGEISALEVQENKVRKKGEDALASPGIKELVDVIVELKAGGDISVMLRSLREDRSDDALIELFRLFEESAAIQAWQNPVGGNELSPGIREKDLYLALAVRPELLLGPEELSQIEENLLSVSEGLAGEWRASDVGRLIPAIDVDWRLVPGRNLLALSNESASAPELLELMATIIQEEPGVLSLTPKNFAEKLEFARKALARWGLAVFQPEVLHALLMIPHDGDRANGLLGRKETRLNQRQKDEINRCRPLLYGEVPRAARTLALPLLTVSLAICAVGNVRLNPGMNDREVWNRSQPKLPGKLPINLDDLIDPFLSLGILEKNDKGRYQFVSTWKEGALLSPDFFEALDVFGRIGQEFSTRGMARAAHAPSSTIPRKVQELRTEVTSILLSVKENAPSIREFFRRYDEENGKPDLSQDLTTIKVLYKQIMTPFIAARERKKFDQAMRSKSPSSMLSDVKEALDSVVKLLKSYIEEVDRLPIDSKKEEQSGDERAILELYDIATQLSRRLTRSLHVGESRWNPESNKFEYRREKVFDAYEINSLFEAMKDGKLGLDALKGDSRKSGDSRR